MDSLFEAANVRLAPGALDLIRQLAAERRLEQLDPDRRATALMLYRDGALTVGDWAESLTASATAPLRFFATMDSVSLRAELERMVRDRLVLRAADALGYTLSDAEYAEILEDAYQLLSMEARRAGFRREELLGGEETIETAVARAFQRQPTFRFGRLSIALRQGRNIRVYPDRFRDVLEKVEELRPGHEQASP